MGRNNCHFVNLQGAQPNELYIRVKHNVEKWNETREMFQAHPTGLS